MIDLAKCLIVKFQEKNIPLDFKFVNNVVIEIQQKKMLEKVLEIDP